MEKSSNTTKKFDKYKSVCMSIRNLLYNKMVTQDGAMELFSKSFDLQEYSSRKSRQEAREKLYSPSMTYEGFHNWLTASCTDNKKIKKFKSGDEN